MALPVPQWSAFLVKRCILLVLACEEQSTLLNSPPVSSTMGKSWQKPALPVSTGRKPAFTSFLAL